MKTKIWLSSVLLLLSGLAQANDPVPLKILVGFGAGGSADLAARLLAERLKDELGRPVVVENRVGAGGRIAAEALKNAPPNGSTVMLAPIVVPVLAPLVFKKLNYDAQKDLAPVAHIADFQFGVSVKADSPIRSIADLVPVVKKNPQSGSFGSPAPGSLPHFFGVMIGQKMGLDMTHVPYKGGGPLMNDAIAGHVPLAVGSLFLIKPHADSGNVTPLAVSTSKRSKDMPNVPTIAESGFPGFDAPAWWGVIGPAKMPPAITSRIHAAVAAALGKAQVLVAIGIVNTASGKVTDGFRQ